VGAFLGTLVDLLEAIKMETALYVIGKLVDE
jgi:hypothetical protein